MASPRVGRGGGGFSAQWFNVNPDAPGGVRSTKIDSHLGVSGLRPVLDNMGMSGTVDHSGTMMPLELPRYGLSLYSPVFGQLDGSKLETLPFYIIFFHMFDVRYSHRQQCCCLSG